MRQHLLFGAVSAVLVLACGGDEETPAQAGDNTAYTSDPNKTVVIGGTSGDAATAQASGGCVKLPSGQCVDAKPCAGGERRDVVVDSAGTVVAVVCYP